MKRWIAALATVIVLCATGQANAAIQYVLGDVDDGLYDGVGSIDDVYFDPDWYDSVSGVTGWPRCDFDIWEANRERPFTFLFELDETEQVVAAELTLRIRAVDHAYESDRVYLESLDYNHSFVDLGWTPLTTGGEPWTYSGAEFVTRTLDLSDFLGDNLLPLLQDGQLNVMLQDDCVIDYATLTLDVAPIPEPSTLIIWSLLGSLGIGFGWWRRRKAA
jgi:hypothetical protein